MHALVANGGVEGRACVLFVVADKAVALVATGNDTITDVILLRHIQVKTEGR